MLKKEELRLGNVLKIGKYFTIVEGVSTWDDLIQSSAFAERTIDEFQPVDLANDWFELFGFDLYPWGLSKGRFLVQRVNNYTFRFRVGNGFEKHLQYVHELQNLYHAMTGEDLSTEYLPVTQNLKYRNETT